MQLTWDLVIAILFVAIIAFSFIVGKDRTQKLIIATYIAILATDGISYLVYRLLFSPDRQISVLSVSATPTTFITLRLFIFVASVVLLTSRGSFEARFPGSTSGILGLFVQGALGFFLAALVVSTILVFLSGGCFLPGIVCSGTNLAVYLSQASSFVSILLRYAYVWFMLPAVFLIVTSALSSDEG